MNIIVKLSNLLKFRDPSIKRKYAKQQQALTRNVQSTDPYYVITVGCLKLVALGPTIKLMLYKRSK